jgi:hypothetical protein
MKTRSVIKLTSEELDLYLKEEGFTKYCNQLDKEAQALGVIPERCEYCNSDLEGEMELYCSKECEELSMFNF